MSLANFSLVNAPFWAVHPVYSENVWVRNLRVNTSWDRPNTDGVDPEACKDVLVENCVISAGDDAVALTAVARRPRSGRRPCALWRPVRSTKLSTTSKK